MITDFAELLTKDEINTLVSKLRQMRQNQGLVASNDEILVLVSWARAIRRNDRLLTLFLMSPNDEMLVDVFIDPVDRILNEKNMDKSK
ncbi:MAG: hypothetical protein WC499_04945, partial [Patescibacteria group bacterium]